MSDTTDQPRKRITIDAPSEMTVLAARHLDATEGPVQIGRTVDTAARSAITTVLRYIAKAHNSPAAEAPAATATADSPRRMLTLNCSTCGTTGIAVWADHANVCPGPPRGDAPTEPLARVRHLEGRLWENSDARELPVSAVCHSIANDLRIALACEDHRPTPPDLSTGTRGEYSQWVIETKLGRRLAVCVDKSPYPEDARQQLEALRAAHPGTVFRAVRETTTRTEEDW